MVVKKDQNENQLLKTFIRIIEDRSEMSVYLLEIMSVAKI